MKTKKEILVLYSGGKDSSATAILLAQMGYRVKLFTCEVGHSEKPVGPNGDSASSIRHTELLRVFPENIDSHKIVQDDSYLIRKLGLEKTNIEHVVYPIVLALAVHSTAICYCLKNNIDTIASGYSGYQAEKEDKYIEQRSDFIELTKKFLKEYGISYLTPLIKNSESEVKDILERYGISSNSLESKAIFGGIKFDKKEALRFWNSSLPICRKFIENIQTVSKKDGKK